jgi:hypothetical protein
MSQETSQQIPGESVTLPEVARGGDSKGASWGASILLLCVVVGLLGIVTGIVLQVLGKLSPQITQIAGSLGGLMAFISTVFGSKLQGSVLDGLGWIWKRANKSVVIPLGVFMVLIPTLVAVLAPIIQPGLPSLPNPYPPNNGSLVVSDPLHDNSKGYGWDTTPTPYGTCDFGGGAYHVIPTVVGSYHRCGPQNIDSFSNFAYEVQLSILYGDCGGIIFRGDFARYRYYYFQICADGSFHFSIYTQKGSPAKTLTGSNPNINRGNNQSNLLAVVAIDNSITIYVNHQSVYHIQDGTYSQGQIGVAAEYMNAPTGVAFSNLNVWKL